MIFEVIKFKDDEEKSVDKTMYTVVLNIHCTEDNIAVHTTTKIQFVNQRPKAVTVDEM